MVAMAASPTPNSTTASTKAHHHPPYKEMIIRALKSLKDRKGSSKVAIAKHIAANYSDLPPAHDALLSTHLRRLKKNGIIQMIKHSYKLLSPTATAAGSSIPLTVVPKKRGRPPKNLTPVAPEVVKRKPGRPPNSTEKRKPGRPRKGLLNAMPKPKPKSVGAGEKRKAGRPKKVLTAVVEYDGGSNASAPLPLPENSLALVPTSVEDGNVGNGTVTLGEKRKRGRPKREAVSGVQPSPLPKKRRQPPKERDLAVPRKTGSETKRPVGRPRKNLEA